MKNYSPKPAPSKLVAKFDRDLMNILMEDLKVFHAKNPHLRKVAELQKLAA
jgi:hypothetical protein